MQVKIMAEGGSMKPGPSLSQQLGPAGVNINKVIEKVNEATRNFKGMKVPVELDINTSTKEFEVKVFSPPIAELLKGELGIQKGSGEQKKFNPANASIEQIISVARIKMSGLLDKNLKNNNHCIHKLLICLKKVLAFSKLSFEGSKFACESF